MPSSCPPLPGRPSTWSDLGMVKCISFSSPMFCTSASCQLSCQDTKGACMRQSCVLKLKAWTSLQSYKTTVSPFPVFAVETENLLLAPCQSPVFCWYARSLTFKLKDLPSLSLSLSSLIQNLPIRGIQSKDVWREAIAVCVDDGTLNIMQAEN